MTSGSGTNAAFGGASQPGERQKARNLGATHWLDYAARGRNAWWRYVVATPLALLIAILLGVVLVLAARLSKFTSLNVLGQTSDPSHPAAFFTGILVSFGLVLAGFVAALRLVHAKRFGDLLGRWQWSAVAIGAAAWIVAQVIATAADVAVSPHALRLTASSASLVLVLLATPALALQTFTEEFIFRGYVTQGLFLAMRRPLLTSVLSGLVFGAVHIPNGAPQAVGATLFGMTMAFAAIRTGSLAFGFGVHLANNLYGGVLVASDADVFKGAPALITEHAQGLLWWDVGVEAALLAVLALLLVRMTPAQSLGVAVGAGPTPEPA
jgi:membrane protease YdiL (CAAX protease family)